MLVLYAAAFLPVRPLSLYLSFPLSLSLSPSITHSLSPSLRSSASSGNAQNTSEDLSRAASTLHRMGERVCTDRSSSVGKQREAPEGWITRVYWVH